MSDIIVRLNDIKAALTAAFPLMVVTRSLKDFRSRPKEELAKGVLTLISRSLDGFSDPVAEALQEPSQQLYLIYQFKLPEKTPGEEIEDQEITQFEAIQSALETEGLCPLTIKNVQQSGQQDAPYGWILITLKWEE